jgi:7-cyano-7-deazaguanine synthase
MNKKYAVLSLSGGMDSSTLLLHLLNEGYDCTCLSFDYGQKHKVELERATELVEYINSFPIENNFKGLRNYCPVKHQIIKLDGLAQLLNSSLVEGGSEVPEGHYAEENMKDTVVPNRNKIFSSIIQAVALSLATKDLGNGHLEKRDVKIALGIHSGDHSIYPDCRQEFRDADEVAFKLGNWDSDLVNYYTPYLNTDKFGILKDGKKCCEQLGLGFNEVYKRTNTSYKPIQHTIILDHGEEVEEWFSDYKSASSVERVEAFIRLGRPDPVHYADEYGPVTWEHVVSYVHSVLENYEKKASDN